MSKENELTKDQLNQLIENKEIEGIEFENLVKLVQNSDRVNDYLPEVEFAVDPRDGNLILYNTSRAKRPHNLQSAGQTPAGSFSYCPICEGKTTGVVDVAELSRGFSFINKNLFPAIYPQRPAGPNTASGMHLLQWTSNQHDQDWHNMPLEDLNIVWSRLASLEKKLLEKEGSYVTIIKNCGKLVGGSLEHGHQQIMLSNVEPNRVWQHQRFEQKHGQKFTEYLLATNPDSLVVKEYNRAVLLVPEFMKRSYQMLLVMKDSKKQYLHELGDASDDLVRGWRDATQFVRKALVGSGREIAYNVLVNTGPGSGIYLEFLPYTQEIGGYENMGLWVCENTPENVVENIKEFHDTD